MTWHYRCMKCRGRNVFRRMLEDYLRPKRCRHCGHGAFYLDRARQWRTDYCRCTEGYHYTHRVGSPLCVHNPDFQTNVRVERHGEKLKDVLEDIAFDKAFHEPVEASEECPF